MKTLKLEDLTGRMNMEQGFYITQLVPNKNTTVETFYDCADDFYEAPSSRYLYEKEVAFISTKGKYLNIFIK